MKIIYISLIMLASLVGNFYQYKSSLVKEIKLIETTRHIAAKVDRTYADYLKDDAPPEVRDELVATLVYCENCQDKLDAANIELKRREARSNLAFTGSIGRDRLGLDYSLWKHRRFRLNVGAFISGPQANVSYRLDRILNVSNLEAFVGATMKWQGEWTPMVGVRLPL